MVVMAEAVGPEANLSQEIRDANEKARVSIVASWKSIENTQSLIDNRKAGGDEVLSERDLADIVSWKLLGKG